MCLITLRKLIPTANGIHPPNSDIKNERERGEREREREREENTLLHEDKDLGTSRLFSKSVPGDKHSNTVERERERGMQLLRGLL